MKFELVRLDGALKCGFRNLVRLGQVSHLVRNPGKSQPRALVADLFRLLRVRLVQLRMPKFAIRSGAGRSVAARLDVWRRLWC